MHTMSSTSERTNPNPTPAVDFVAVVYVLQVRAFVDDAAVPAIVNGRLSAARRTHLSQVVSSAGSSVLFARCARERQRESQYRAC
jgi:hypothetical protein